jgi:hypothetical protein
LVQNNLTEAKHGLVFPKTIPLIFRALWFSFSIVSSIWFLYWICYDVIVWNKVLSQVRPANYIGLTVSIALAIVGTQLGRLHNFEQPMLSPEHFVHKKVIKNKQALEREQMKPFEKVQQTQSAKDEIKEIPPDCDVPPGCKFYLGYLHMRPVSGEIPEECLECEHVVGCLSPTSTTITTPA